jgi:glutamate transport system substrate-binding protein
MRRQRLVLAALGAALALALAGCGGDGGTPSGSCGNLPAVPAGSTMEKIQQKGKLVVGTKFDQPLFGLNNPISGKVEGFDVEIAKEVAKAIFGADANLDQRVEFKEAISRNREPFLQEGQVDIVVATYTINDDRKKKVGFAGPYYEAGQDIMVKADNSAITGVDDLNGKNVCTVEGSTSQKNLAKFAPQAKPLFFDTYSKCAEALGDGRVEAVTTDNVILLGLIDASKGAYKLVGKPFTEEPYGIGVKLEATDLRNFITDELEKMYNDGRWKRAFESTVGKVEKNTPEPPAVNRY